MLVLKIIVAAIVVLAVWRLIVKCCDSIPTEG
jgi:chromate transport protein ChrA